MNEVEVDLFKKTIATKFGDLVHDKDLFTPSEIAEILAQEIRYEYWVRRKRDDQRYLMIPYGERLPCCEGCFNEFGSCGTPCVECDRQTEFKSQWTLILDLPNKFIVYERR